jgi:hypothetical protein
VLHAELNGMPLISTSLAEMDAYNSEWQNTPGTPVDICVAGYNLIALSPVPDGIYSVTLDVIRSTPLTDPVQLGREELEAILGYAEHLAMFKIAGPEWVATKLGWESMLKVASNFNARLKAAIRYRDVMASTSTREHKVRPRRLGE